MSKELTAREDHDHTFTFRHEPQVTDEINSLFDIRHSFPPGVSTGHGCKRSTRYPMNLRFHWMLPKGGEVALKTAQEAARYRLESRDPTSPAALPDMDGWLRFAQRAEDAGIESVLMSFSRYEPDTLIAACALGRATTTLKFIAAYRAGLIEPVSFVHQVNTLSALIGGRLALNMVAGSSSAEQRGYGDFLDHDARYARAAEFLAICRSFWRGEGRVDFAGRY